MEHIRAIIEKPCASAYLQVIEGLGRHGLCEGHIAGAVAYSINAGLARVNLQCKRHIRHLLCNPFCKHTEKREQISLIEGWRKPVVYMCCAALRLLGLNLCR